MFTASCVCVCVCVCLCVCAGEEEKEEVPKSPAFYLMQPGRWVFMRHATTQFASEDGVGWRKVQVQKWGTLGETDFGEGDAEGWWCSAPPRDCLLKFFLRERILEIHPLVDFFM